MRNKRRIVHIIHAGSFQWDLTERKWVIWAKHVGAGARLLHSAKKARKDFEKLCRQPPCLRRVRWLTYKNGKLAKVRTVGYMKYPIHATYEVNHACLNPGVLFWKELSYIVRNKEKVA